MINDKDAVGLFLTSASCELHKLFEGIAGESSMNKCVYTFTYSY